MHFSTLLSFLFFFLPLLTLAAPNNCLILVPGDDEPTFEAAWARDGVGNYSSYQYVNFIEVSSGGERIPVLSAAGDGSSDGRELCITAEGRLYVFEGYPYEPAPSDVSYPVIVPGWKETWVLGRAGRNGTKGFSVDGDYNLDFKSATIYGKSLPSNGNVVTSYS